MGTRLAVTGASGFVGRHLIRHASASGLEVLGLARSEAAGRAVAEAGGRPVRAAFPDDPEWVAAIRGVLALVHLAQIGAERGGASYDAVNVEGTRRASAGARAAGVTRIVFLSGLGVARYGMTPRCTNRYFLSKLAAEVELHRSGLEVTVFRPSYVLGPGDGLVRGLLAEMAAGEVERIGDGAYRLQPIAVRDAVEVILAATAASGPRPRCFDLVGPEPIAYAAFLERLAAVARALGKAGAFGVREVPLAEADRLAGAGGYRGMLSDELDCLLCDEVADPRPLESLLGRFLTPLDDALRAAVRAV